MGAHAENYEVNRTHSSHRQQSSSQTGRRFPTQQREEQGMEITGEKKHNVLLVKHIRATSSKCSGAFGLAEQELRTRMKELEKIAQYAPLLKLRVGLTHAGDQLKHTRQGNHPHNQCAGTGDESQG